MTDQAITDTIVRELGRHRTQEEVARTVCEQFGLSWGEAEERVRSAALDHGGAIAGRQSPLLLAFIVGGLLGGVALIGRLVLVYLAVGPQAMISLGMVAQAGTGLLMVIGALGGIFQLVRSLGR